MSTLRVGLSPREMAFDIDDQAGSVPVGPSVLAADLEHDPPLPEELTNAIGLVLDHMEDIEREVPAVHTAERIEVSGPGIDVLAAVEAGGATPLPFELSRDAAEDIFRTLVTESSSERVHNPGLPPAMVHDVLGVVSTVVAMMRFLHADTVWLVGT